MTLFRLRSSSIFSFDPRSYATEYAIQQPLGVRRNKAGLDSRQRPLLISQQRTDGKQVNKVVTPKAGFSTQPDRAWNEAADNVVSNEAYVEFSFIVAVCVCKQFRGGRNNPLCRGNQPFDAPRRPAKVRTFTCLFHTSFNVTLTVLIVNLVFLDSDASATSILVHG